MHVGIVGLGYVGLPLAVSFCEAGHDVVGVDVDPRKVEAIGRSESYIEDVPSEQLAAVQDRLVATARFAELTRCDAVIIAVPTPLTRNREPDLGAAARRGRGDRAHPAARPAGRARVHHVSREPRASGSCRCSRSRA